MSKPLLSRNHIRGPSYCSTNSSLSQMFLSAGLVGSLNGTFNLTSLQAASHKWRQRHTCYTWLWQVPEYHPVTPISSPCLVTTYLPEMHVVLITEGFKRQENPPLPLEKTVHRSWNRSEKIWTYSQLHTKHNTFHYSGKLLHTSMFSLIGLYS